MKHRQLSEGSFTYVYACRVHTTVQPEGLQRRDEPINLTLLIIDRYLLQVYAVKYWNT